MNMFINATMSKSDTMFSEWSASSENTAAQTPPIPCTKTRHSSRKTKTVLLLSSHVGFELGLNAKPFSRECIVVLLIAVKVVHR